MHPRFPKTVSISTAQFCGQTRCAVSGSGNRHPALKQSKVADRGGISVQGENSGVLTAEPEGRTHRADFTCGNSFAALVKNCGTFLKVVLLPHNPQRWVRHSDPLETIIQTRGWSPLESAFCRLPWKGPACPGGVWWAVS